MQNTFNKSDPEQQLHMTQIAVTNFMELSSNKFGSNIIEVMLKSHNTSVKDMVVDTIFLGEGNEDCLINRLMKDQFGNYVLKSAIQYLSYDVSDKIIEHVINY